MTGLIADIISSLFETMVGSFLGKVIDYNRVIKLKSEIIMLDINYKAMYEESEYNEIPKCIGEIPDNMIIEFTITAYNPKSHTSGMSDCKVILEYSDGNKVEIGKLFDYDDDINELDNLLNIESKTTVKARYRQREMFWRPERLRSGFKVYLEYRISENKKVSTPFKIHETKSLVF